MTTTRDTHQQAPLRLDRGQGSIAYESAGSGPLVVLVPGMGDLRSTYRFLAPALVEHGYRVVVTDLRGHGDSDATFGSYGDVDTAGDILALVDRLGGPAIVVGNSMGAGAAVVAAAERPELIRGLVLVGPFVRDGRTSRLKRLAFRVAMARWWAAGVWLAYLPKLFAGRRPADLDEHLDAVRASLRRPGKTRAFSATTRTTHAPAEARLDQVGAPALVVMGEQDPDFPDPVAEAEWIGRRLHATVVLVPEAGHYPQAQRPDVVVPAVAAFLDRMTGRA